MRIIFLMLILGILLSSTGCAVVMPPPFVRSKTIIVKDENGKVVKSEYTRKVTGFTYGGDKEDARSFARADSQARKSGVNFPDSDVCSSATVLIRNNSSYPLSIASGPLQGVALAPGEVSPDEKVVPLGMLTFEIEWVDCRGKKRHKKVSRVIGEDTSEVVLRDVVR